MKQKKALVIGAGGFIGHNLVKRLKGEGWHVTGLDIKKPEYQKTSADKFIVEDAINHKLTEKYDRIYQLGADMGGAGFVFTGDNDAEILNNSLSINLNILREVKRVGVGQIFYSSSVCCYPDAVKGVEEDAYPANPPSNYGWEKLTSERLYLAYAENHGVNVRIARFHNCFGPYGTYKGGREKSPAAMCRKIIESNGEIEIWGDGNQLRPFIYIDDLLDGIEALMSSEHKTPVNLGPSEGITINQLIEIISKIANKPVKVTHIKGPTGGAIRNANNDLAQRVLNWKPKRSLEESLQKTYEWIKGEMEKDEAPQSGLYQGMTERHFIMNGNNS